MKYSKINIFAFVFILLCSNGCEKFLTEKPYGVLSPATFYNSDEEAKQAVNGLYVRLYDAGIYGGVGIKNFYMYGADVIEPSREVGTFNDMMHYTISEAKNPGGQSAWTSFYKLIQNANTVIDRVRENENLSIKGRDQSLGEALFLRSFAYYHLTNMFGDVPYYRDDLAVEDSQSLGRFDKNQIREDILADLQEAEDLLPGSYSGNEQGRATKWAAAMLMAKIYLIQQKWQEARDKSVEIVERSTHRLLDNYADVFDPNDEYNDEIIFQAVFVRDLNPIQTTDSFNPRLRDEPKVSSQRNALEAALAARNEGFTGFGHAIPAKDLVEKYPDNDLRRPSNIIQNYLGFDLRFPYMPKMWNLDNVNSPRSNHGENYIVFRLADVYLMAAEAENELNGPGNAYQYINKVRERAYDPLQPLLGLDQQGFRQAIYDERKWELAGECHRRMDLIRWGILVDVIKQTEYYLFNDARENIRPHMIHLPIPENEIERNPVLLESDPTNNGYR